MMPPRRRPKWFLALFAVLVPLWIVGVVADLLDARRLEKEAVTVPGRIVSGEWVAGRRGGRTADLHVTWNHRGQQHTRTFNLTSDRAATFLAPDGKVLQPLLDVLCADSRPDLAALAVQPPDPAWVSALLGTVGLGLVCGVGWFLHRFGFWHDAPAQKSRIP